MKWRIVADSSCDLMMKDVVSEAVAFTTVPFVLQVGEQDYIDDEQAVIPEILDAMENCATASRSACPSPQTWAEEFEKADALYEDTIIVHCGREGLELLREYHFIETCAVLEGRKLYAL